MQDMRGRLFAGLRFRVLGSRLRSFGRRAGEDPRLTRVGRVLRRSGLEDWPQLWNVLCGRMSLVGPRPVRPEQAERLHDECPAFCERFSDIKPGLFGYAQGDGPGDGTWLGVACEKIVFDLHYQARLATQAPWRVVFDDLDMIAANLASRWLGRGRGRGQDVIRIEYPARFVQLPLSPEHLARRTPADLGSEVHVEPEGLTAWWYPPRRRAFDLPTQPDAILGTLCDAVIDDGAGAGRYRKDLAPGVGQGSDRLVIELPPSLQDAHRLCAHLDTVWQALAPRSDDPHLGFSASFLLVEGLARAAGSARPGERLSAVICVGPRSLELSCAAVPAASRVPALAGVG